MIWKGLYLFVLSTLLFGVRICAQESVELSLPFGDRTFNDNRLDFILSAIAQEYNLPIGFEPVLFNHVTKQPAPRSVEVRAKTLKEAFDTLLVVFPDYKWNASDGVAVFSAHKYRDPVVSQILDTKIAMVRVKKTKGSMGIGEDLFQAPELTQKSRSLGITSVHFYPSISHSELDERAQFDFLFHNKTVREILNQLVKETNSKYWTIVRWGNEGEFISIALP